jgi:hypothetical protein
VEFDDKIIMDILDIFNGYDIFKESDLRMLKSEEFKLILKRHWFSKVTRPNFIVKTDLTRFKFDEFNMSYQDFWFLQNIWKILKKAFKRDFCSSPDDGVCNMSDSDCCVTTNVSISDRNDSSNGKPFVVLEGHTVGQKIPAWMRTFTNLKQS